MLKRIRTALAVAFLLTFILTFFLTALAAGQDERFDASINGGEVFTNTPSGNSIVQSATAGPSIFGTFRYKFRPRHSLVFNYGRSKNSQTYLAANNFHVQDSISEVSGAYMFSFTKGSFEPFVLAGGGMLRFGPSNTWVVFPDLPGNVPDRVQVYLGASSQTQLTFLYGLGADYRLPWFSRLSLRLQYRGFLYKAPDFNVNANSGSQISFFTGAKEHMAQPSIGFVYRF
ncbi:MAG: outer membrane beta-barrel protein [Terriglobales bacterium]